MSDNKEKVRITATELTALDVAMLGNIAQRYAKYDVDEEEMMHILLRVGMLAVLDSEDKAFEESIEFSRYCDKRGAEKPPHEA